MFHIKDDFKSGQPVASVPAEWFNKVARVLNTMRAGTETAHDIIKTDSGKEWIFPNGSGGSDIAVQSEDFEVDSIDNTSGTVDLAGGFVQGFGNTAVIAAATVTCGGTVGSPEYIYAYGQVRPTATGAIATTSSGTLPVHADNAWVYLLYKVWIADGAIVLHRCRPIDLKSWYGP